MKKKTVAIQGGYEKDKQSTMSVPIYQTTAYQFKDLEQAADRFALRDLGNIYTRLTNPTTDVFEKRVALLEGAEAAIATSSGMSAIFYSIVNVAQAGDNILYASQLYGGTLVLFEHTLKRFGIKAKCFDALNLDEVEALIDSKTKAIFFESITNPSIDVMDMSRLVEIANKHNILTICDNTVATPFLCHPISLGVDIVVHSCSKYITGQGLGIGGVLAQRTGLTKKIKNNPRYSSFFDEPDMSYHGLVYTDLPLPIFTTRIRISLLRDIGAVGSPFNSWLFIQGLETLGIRIKEHSKNALEIAKFLESHPKVLKVYYPLLENSRSFKNAKKYLKGGASGLISFVVDNYDVAKKIASNTNIFSVVANIGDSKSMIIHPASTTHQQLTDEELANAGIEAGLIRLSIGLEDIKDLISDLSGALE